MLTTIELLDAAKQRNAFPSDYRLAKELGVVQSAVKNYRAGRSHPDDRVVHKLAELAGEDVADVAVWMQIERARDDQARSLWQTVAARLHQGVHGTLGAFAAGAVILSALFAASPDAAATLLTYPTMEVGSVCILCLLALWLRTRAHPSATYRRGADFGPSVRQHAALIPHSGALVLAGA